MTTHKVIASVAAAAMLVVSVPAFAMPAGAVRVSPDVVHSDLIQVRDRYRHRHHGGNGAAVGAALGAGIFLGALAASSAQADEYYAPPPPPPAPVYGGGYGRYEEETADEAIAACRQGLLDVARRHGAYDAEIDQVDYVREKPEGGHRVRAEVTMMYSRGERTSDVVCHTEDGRLLSATTE